MRHIAILSHSLERAKYFIQNSLQGLEQMPVSVAHLDQLRGWRDGIIIILPDTTYDIRDSYILSNNLVIDLNAIR